MADSFTNYEAIENQLKTEEAKKVLEIVSNYLGMAIFDDKFTEFFTEELRGY